MHRVVSDKLIRAKLLLSLLLVPFFSFYCGVKDFEMHSAVLHNLLSARKAIFSR